MVSHRAFFDPCKVKRVFHRFFTKPLKTPIYLREPKVVRFSPMLRQQRAPFPRPIVVGQLFVSIYLLIAAWDNGISAYRAYCSKAWATEPSRDGSLLAHFSPFWISTKAIAFVDCLPQSR